MIKQFQNQYRWLSNFAPVNIKIFNGNVYPSVEHAYMAAKSFDNDWQILCMDKNNSPGKIKRKSKNILLRSDWNDKTRLIVMQSYLEIKFAQEPYKTKLIETGNQNIQEGNYWNDKFFGICLKTNEGENHLGRLIMQIRETL